MSVKTLNLTPELYTYLLQTSLRESTILKKLREETQQLNSFNMQISPEQGQFMALLVQLIGAKKTLDIGTFTGYSALSVAASLPESAKVIACDVNAEWTQIAKKYWQAAHLDKKIELRLAPALQTLDLLLEQGEAGTFDFAFIDADKQNYPHYYERALSLVRVGGLIAIDNTLWGGRVADANNQEKNTQVIRDLNSFIHQDQRVDMSLIPIGDGLTLARKR